MSLNNKKKLKFWINVPIKKNPNSFRTFSHKIRKIYRYANGSFFSNITAQKMKFSIKDFIVFWAVYSKTIPNHSNTKVDSTQ